jgi:hypothetical protein
MYLEKSHACTQTHPTLSIFIFYTLVSDPKITQSGISSVTFTSNDSFPW